VAHHTSQDELISIGEFAARTRLSAKDLRIYDRIGLLRPATVEEDSRYRRNSIDQIRIGQLVGMLRGAELSLADIRLVLEDLDRDRSQAVTRITRLITDIEQRHATRKLLLDHIQATITEGDNPMFLIKTRHVPSRHVMSIRRRLNASETDSFVHQA
jgi:DNA-binding transcriptional MerR regulator